MSDLLFRLNQGRGIPLEVFTEEETPDKSVKTALNELLVKAMSRLLFGRMTLDPKARYELFQM